MKVCGVTPQLHLDNGRSFSLWYKDGVIPIKEHSQTKGGLSKEVFGRRTTPGIVPFFILICLVATKSVLLSVFTRMQTICPYIQEVHCSKRQNVHFWLTCSLTGWFSNRTGTSADDGARRSNNWPDQWQSGILGTESRVKSFPRAFPSSTDFPVLLLNQPNVSAGRSLIRL